MNIIKYFVKRKMNHEVTELDAQLVMLRLKISNNPSIENLVIDIQKRVKKLEENLRQQISAK